MNNKHKLIPKRRFKEFENADAWEQRKLGSFADVTKLAGFEFTEHVVYSDSGKIIALRGLNVKEGKLVLNDVKYIDGSNFDKLNRSKLFKNDIFFTYFGTVGDVAIIKENDRFYLAPNVARIRIQSNDSPIFVSHFMRNDNFYRQIILPLIATSSQPALSMENIRKFELYLPSSRKEQDKSAELFENLDKEITLHQRKLNKLAEIKSAYLSELFPVPGELKPKRRFAGYIDDWEQYEFADLLDKEDGIRRGPFGSALKKEYFVSKSDYVVYEQQNAIYDRFDTRYYITREKYEELHKFILEPEDFILSGAGTVGRISRVPKNIRKGVFNQALIRIKIENKNMDPDFFLQWMRSESMQKKLTYGNPASAIVNLVPIDEIKKWKVIVPSLDEQVKIGNLLNKLDEAIKSQNRKIEKLQNLKESYLNEMFV